MNSFFRDTNCFLSQETKNRFTVAIQNPKQLGLSHINPVPHHWDRISMVRKLFCVSVYLLGSEWSHLLWTAKTIRNHNWWTLWIVISSLEPSSDRKKTRLENRHAKVILQHNNARSHVHLVFKNNLDGANWEVLNHTPNSLGLSFVPLYF